MPEPSTPRKPAFHTEPPPALMELKARLATLPPDQKQKAIAELADMVKRWMQASDPKP